MSFTDSPFVEVSRVDITPNLNKPYSYNCMVHFTHVSEPTAKSIQLELLTEVSLSELVHRTERESFNGLLIHESFSTFCRIWNFEQSEFSRLYRLYSHEVSNLLESLKDELNQSLYELHTELSMVSDYLDSVKSNTLQSKKGFPYD